MKTFRFDPTLFEKSSRARDVLDRAGINWFEHYSAIDLEHEIGGLEIAGIKSEAGAKRIASLMASAFPRWKYLGYGFAGEKRLDGGWYVLIHEFPRPPKASL